MKGIDVRYWNVSLLKGILDDSLFLKIIEQVLLPSIELTVFNNIIVNCNEFANGIQSIKRPTKYMSLNKEGVSLGDSFHKSNRSKYSTPLVSNLFNSLNES